VLITQNELSLVNDGATATIRKQCCGSDEILAITCIIFVIQNKVKAENEESPQSSVHSLQKKENNT